MKEDFEEDDVADDDRDLPLESDMSDDDEPVDPCPHCGKAVHEEAEWCHHCGNYLSREDSAERSVPLWVILTAMVLLTSVVFWVFFLT